MKLYLKVCSCICVVWGVFDLIQFFATDSLSAIQRLNVMTQFDYYVVLLIVTGVIKAIMMTGGGIVGYIASNDNVFFLEYAYITAIVLLPLTILNAYFAVSDVINPTAVLAACISLGATIMFFTIVSSAKKNKEKLFSKESHV